MIFSDLSVNTNLSQPFVLNFLFGIRCYGVAQGSETGECMYLGSYPSCSGSCPGCTCTADSVFRSGVVAGNLCVNTTLAMPGWGSGIQLKGRSWEKNINS